MTQDQINAGLRLYSRSDVAELTGQSVRGVVEDENNPACPLRWTHKLGTDEFRGFRVDYNTLKDYLRWLEVER